MSKTPERKVKDKIRAVLIKYDVWHYMPVPTGRGVAGVPDFLCCVKGRFFAVEAKAGSNPPTELQILQMDKICEAGGVAIVVNEDNLGELEELVRSLCR